MGDVKSFDEKSRDQLKNILLNNHNFLVSNLLNFLLFKFKIEVGIYVKASFSFLTLPKHSMVRGWMRTWKNSF